MSQPLYADFTAEEYEHRWARARALMATNGLDGLLITQERNYIYFTGHRSEQNANDKIRPYVFILPREGDPVLVLMAFEVPHAQLATYVDDIRTSPLMGHVEVISQALRDRGLGLGTIGAELGREQYLGISYNDFQGLGASLPGATFADAASVLLELRSVKSQAEVAYCRRAAEIAATAHVECFAAARAGMTEHEVARLFRIKAMENGAEFITLTITTGHDLRAGKKITVPTDRVIEVGDTVTIDVGVRVQGYSCDVARTAIVGEPAPEQVAAYKMQRELARTCFTAIRPGATPHDVMQLCMDELQRIGQPLQSVGRIGHGVGLEAAEYPSLALNERMPFQEGMVFACNPNFVTEHGFYNCEENLVVTADGFEVFSVPEALPEPPLIAA